MPQLSQAQMANMRELMAQNPEMTQALIQQLGATHPALLHQLGENPEEVIRQILRDDDRPDDDTAVLSVTPEERAAIERVRLLIFPRKIPISHSLQR